MAYILNIETSTKNCSVSIANDGELICLKEINTGGYSHAEKLHPFIHDCLLESKLDFSQIDAVCVGKGPGSYTGLRIGVSAAKGFCFANDIPLIAINSLEILAHSTDIDNGFIVPLIDARRMEVYSSVFSNQKEKVRETQAEIIDNESFNEYLEKGAVYFLGDGAEKCKEIINHKNAHFIDSHFPSAKNMVQISYEKYKKNDVENVAYFEPFYLKDFVATKQKK
ncbi:tRNA (adenosine(37)-N6)-threonylcarbamoyltransferase complex dimerization subunit type 1 TsaB [Pseudotenacibaculum sp. MALMAid0570]|uniref:tRNA (adenosine(37)-N6)-threonylcarbamoyltransferase complex dimerization subunit type 1 TsaB n=1 Tax=Pseudotenacibaculum sp. MALMAid0570 TaxID=3143938 RepID=UPI0032E04B9F